MGLWPEQRQSKEGTRRAADSSASGRGFARLGAVWTGSGSLESVWGRDRRVDSRTEGQAPNSRYSREEGSGLEWAPKGSSGSLSGESASLLKVG